MVIKLVQIFDKAVPLDFQKACVRSIQQAYDEAYRRTGEDLCLEKEEGHDLLPYLRRTLIERNLKNLARYYQGVHVSTRKNAARNCHHNVIHIGNLMMTISSIDYPSRKVRQAKFRDNYIQMTLFDFLRCQNEEIFPIEGGLCYLIICHGEDIYSKGRLGFVKIVFPDTNGNYIPVIDLLSRFPEVITPAPETEIISEDLPINVREQREKREA